MSRERIQVMVEIGLTIALSAALSLLRLRLPINIFGGTISLSMLPILVLAIRRGLGPGLMAGALYGFVDLLFDPYVVHPAQLLLDYPIAYGMLGLAGLGAGLWRSAIDKGHIRTAVAVAVPWLTLGALGRLGAHWVSGVIFFGANAPEGQPVWLYSLVYNLSYWLPSFVICIIAAVILLPVLELAVPSSPSQVPAS